MLPYIKNIIKKIPFPLTQNQRYDAQTWQIMKRTLHPTANCIDVGCHKGEMLELMLQFAPQGQHFCFEPLPDFFDNLGKNFPQPNCHFYNIALSDSVGETTFNYVISNPAYSGILRRRYDKPNEQDTNITVKLDTLDNIIPSDVQIDFIKIDVEGAELGVLKGAVNTLRRCKPIVVFEHGLGGADVYGTTPTTIYHLLKETCGMEVSLMKSWLQGKPALSLAEFEAQFYQNKNYYFIAYSLPNNA